MEVIAYKVTKRNQTSVSTSLLPDGSRDSNREEIRLERWKSFNFFTS